MLKPMLLRRYRHTLKITLLLAISVFSLQGCSTEPPPNSHDICAVFQEYPNWYWNAIDSYNRWGIPVSVQMAIIQQESDFRGDAQPPRTTLLGIPWSRPTTAYGYAQAVDGTWAEYKRETKNYGASRDDFADATDFIGWYSNISSKDLKISKRNAYRLYLAYHEGLGNYAEGSYRHQQWLLDVADHVQDTANRYRKQLNYCHNKIPKPSSWSWFN
jgi:hypothetical protein